MSFASAERAPVITIDGPTASGKGTVALCVAQALGWQVLDYPLTKASLAEVLDMVLPR